MDAPQSDLRTFVAVWLPESIREAAGRLIATGKKAVSGVTWTDPALVHVTVKFLGEVPPDQLTDIGERLEEVSWSTAPFEASFAGVGAFPDVRRPRVITVGLRRGRDGLVELIGNVEGALESLGFPPEGREIHPHLTLGRAKGLVDPARWRTWLAAHREEDLGSFTVRELALVKSTLRPAGPLYETLASFPLSGEELENGT